MKACGVVALTPCASRDSLMLSMTSEHVMYMSLSALVLRTSTGTSAMRSKTPGTAPARQDSLDLRGVSRQTLHPSIRCNAMSNNEKSTITCNG
eukprot:CAMPEP_0203856604 /NCGR_PEP_ID=MMETSP0359-20131031/10272_1 /ASSEMBLY_ACC=CAM_ASM_000338 /TAXON_ID=268821 /ORGANISM="Scrippsiella Hangoei, Strain SHTV-5" /LENGTH=92 /DNA_ID=CAMNT_0050773235 /DNA_START=117 /DNA_END=395 /DNA_ORIENTATION=+